MNTHNSEAWKKEMALSIDFTNMMEDVIGFEHGISEEEIKKLEPKIREIYFQLKKLGYLIFFIAYPKSK